VAILRRYRITPEIFDILDHTEPGTGGEMQIIDVLRDIAMLQPMYAYDFKGKRYDIGNKQDFLEATKEFALRREDLRDEFKEYLVNLVKSVIFKNAYKEVAFILAPLNPQDEAKITVLNAFTNLRKCLRSHSYR